jgi:PAS domain S-box-containing protein
VPLDSDAERLSLALAAARLGDWSWDATTDIVTFSERAAAIFQIPPGPRMTWTAMRSLLHPDDAERVRLAVEHAIETRTDYDIEYRLVNGSGQRWVSARGRGVYDGAGAVSGMLGVVQDITESVRIRDASRLHADATRASEERYRAFVENSSEGIWRLEFSPPIDTSLPVDEQVSAAYANGRFAECNDVMARMYGFHSPEDLVGKTLDFMLPPSDPDARMYLASIIQAGYRISEVESKERDARGGVKYFSSSMRGVVIDGHLHRVWGSQRDITERKHADRARAYLAAIVDSADDAIISKDLDGIIQSCNAAAERVFGFAAADLIGKPVRILIPQDRQSEEDEILARLRRGERVEHFETVRVRRDGRAIHVSLTVSPVRDATGTIIGASKIARDITEQRKAASAQAFLAAVVSSSDDAIIAKDLDGIIRQCNAATERIFGYAQAELIGQPVRILIPPERQSEEDDILARIRRGERLEHFETKRLRKDGRQLDVSLTISPIIDASGRIVGVSKIARDITAQKHAASELSAQQAWFRITLGSIGDAVIASDPHGQVTFINATAERLTGWREQDAIGHPLHEVFNIINEKTRNPVENPALLVMKLGHVVGLANHTVLIARDGVERPIADSAAPIRDVDNRMLGVVLVFRDVTDERRAEDILAEQREWLETTLESIGDAVIATDVQGRVAFMNPVAEYLTGWSADLARGRSSQEIFRAVDEQNRQSVDDPVSRVLAEGGVVGFGNSHILIAGDGTERTIDQSGAPIRNRDGRISGVVLVFRDVSERRRLDLERQNAAAERERLLEAERAARAEAERASRIKDEFMAMVSHELRTPLNAILGWTQLMMRGKDDPATLERGLDIVSRNTRLQAQLISDLLDVSRIVSGKLQLQMQAVDLHAIASEAIETVRPDADAKGLTLAVSLDRATGAVAGDPARLLQVIWNLLSNAIKFTPAGGRIEITLHRRDGNAELTVSDTGAGIRSDVLPLVFDRFHQADRSITRRFGGLGLGLSIVKHLMELHGGAVSADSAGEDKGATFTISLPTSSPAAPMTSAPVRSKHELYPPVSLESLRVLVVEDEPDTREFLKRLLESQGATVIVAGSAQEALVAVRDQQPQIMISDIGLPDVDGYDLIRTIRQDDQQRRNAVPAIALTAYARPEDRARALLAGYQAHLAKPVEPGELLMTIASFAGMVRPISDGRH